MAKQTERSSRPRAMIHDAQEHAYQWHDMAMRAHQNVADMSEEGIRRMFHTAVLNYWKQLERFKRSSHVRDLWYKDEIEEVGEESTLEDMREMRFKSETIQGGDFDPRSGQVTQTRERPSSLTIRQSTAVLDKLDQVANRLQFDAQAKEERPRYGAIEVDEDDDHHGVEVPEGA
jgi:hypothetical protein